MTHHTDRPDNHDQDDLGITRTDADETSQTRFGPRPVPEGHRAPHGPSGSRRIPPSGPVSPDGQRAYPRPSRLAKWVVWGGTGIAAAALTAGTVYAARHVSDLLSDGTKPKRRGPAPGKPRMQAPGPVERAALHDRPRRHDPMDDTAPRPRRKPAPRKGLMQEIQDNTTSLTHGVDNVMGSLTAAVTGFRTVAAQAAGIMREFSDAAALVRGVMGDAPKPQRARRDPSPRATDYPDRHGAHMPDLRDDPATHDPMRDAAHDDDRFDPRTHRL